MLCNESNHLRPPKRNVRNFPTLLYYLKVHFTMTFSPFSRLKDMKNHTFFHNINQNHKPEYSRFFPPCAYCNVHMCCHSRRVVLRRRRKTFKYQTAFGLAQSRSDLNSVHYCSQVKQRSDSTQPNSSVRRCFNVTDVLTVIILKCLASAGDSIDYVTAIRGLQLIGFFSPICQF